MTLFGKDHYEIMEMFEKQYSHLRLDREDKEWWVKERIYQNGQTNEIFLAYRHGVSYGKATV